MVDENTRLSLSDHNLRAAEIWKIIEPTYDWEGSQVVDLGCGHGDLLWRIYDAGATVVYGIDEQPAALMGSIMRLRARDCPALLGAHRIEEYLATTEDHYDVALCMSVIPYLKLPLTDALQKIDRLADVVYLEIQYDGDGPGTYERDDLRSTLEHVFRKVEVIGSTKAKPFHVRDIWRCT